VTRPEGFRVRLGALAALAIALSIAPGVLFRSDPGDGKRVRVVEPGRLIRAAWQDPATLRKLIDRLRIKTIVTLTAINRDDPKFVGQAQVVAETGVRWIIVPMRGSSATLEQMAWAADLLADRELQPVLFHCVAGHHRTSLAHAAYLIRHRQCEPEAAWEAVAGLPWARPGAPADRNDRALIKAFARIERSLPSRNGESAREADDDDENPFPADH
jgi:protein tyrosine phosphatase (PTP) superfamily phosphohydrolase (DUF442 family)